MRSIPIVALLIWGTLYAPAGLADDVTVDAQGQKISLFGTAKLEDDTAVVLETPEGLIFRIVKSTIVHRGNQPAAAYYKPEALSKWMQAGLGIDGELLRSRVTPECIVILILEAPLSEADESKAEAVLTKTVEAYQRAAKGVEAFAKQHNLPQHKSPLPALIQVFESEQAAFQQYRIFAGLGVGQLYRNGWYTSFSNTAYLSMAQALEADPTSMNVLIWQQFVHSGIFKRSAPVPVWFLVGLGLGFEADATQLKPNHQVEPPAHFLLSKSEFAKADWDKLVADFLDKDQPGDSYSRLDQAATLHWYLLTNKPAEYAQYMKKLAELTPLETYSREKSLADFQDAFGQAPSFFKKLYETKAGQKSAVIAKKVKTDVSDGFSDVARQQFGIGKIKWAQTPKGEDSRVEGELLNTSPLRSRSYCVAYVSNVGKPAVWFVDKLDPGKTVKLPAKDIQPHAAGRSSKQPSGEKKADQKVTTKKEAQKPAGGSGKRKEVTKSPAPAYLNRHEYVQVVSVASDSPQAEKWRQGELPSFETETESTSSRQGSEE